jgi:hypothetical protein
MSTIRNDTDDHLRNLELRIEALEKAAQPPLPAEPVGEKDHGIAEDIVNAVHWHYRNEDDDWYSKAVITVRRKLEQQHSTALSAAEAKGYERAKAEVRTILSKNGAYTTAYDIANWLSTTGGSEAR